MTLEQHIKHYYNHHYYDFEFEDYLNTINGIDLDHPYIFNESGLTYIRENYYPSDLINRLTKPRPLREILVDDYWHWMMVCEADEDFIDLFMTFITKS